VADAPTAPPATPGELVFTDEQLTLLADLAGLPGFPGASRPRLDDAGWTAVAHGLMARGVIHDDDPGGAVRLADAVLGVALHADRWLWITVSDTQDPEAGSGQEILWFKAGVRVRQTVTCNGFHRFSTATPADLLAEMLTLLADAGTPGRPAPQLTPAELEDAVAGAHRVLRFEACRRAGPTRVTGAELTLVESPEYGLCMLDVDPGGAAALAPLTADEARAQLDALAEMIA
jgi:hypothetical protein